MNKILIGLVLSVLIPLQGCWASDAATNSDAKKMAPRSALQSDASYGKGRYKLVKSQEVLIDGKVYSICKELLKNFNSFPDAPPMVCKRKYNPELGFTTPEWKPIQKNDIDWEILRQIYFSKNDNRFSEEGLKKTWAEEKERLEALAGEKTILWSAEFDIDNKAGKEKVYKLYDKICDVDRGPYQTQVSPTMFVLDKDDRIDIRYERLFNKGAGMFIYKQHTYLTSWWGYSSDKDAHISVYDTFMPQKKFGFSNEPICKFQYIK